jgi:HlyD family secretion protein
MNMNPKPTEADSARRRRWWIGGAVAAGIVAVAAGAALLGPSSTVDESSLLFDVKEGPLTIDVTQPGTIQSREMIKVMCEVPGESTVLWLIEEGVHVKAGDLLILLDSNRFDEALTEQVIRVENANAASVRAKEALAVQLLDQAGEVAKAELALELAELSLNAYEEETYPGQLQRAEADITLREEELQRALDKLNWSRTLETEGYITRTELEGDELAYKRADLELTLAKRELRTLTEYTHRRELQVQRADVANAERNLERVKHTQSAQVVQAEADLRAKQLELERQQERLDTMRENLAMCRISAPVDGMVVYSTTGQGGRRPGREEPLAEGVMVRERQHLISLPTATSMMAEVRIHESSIRKIETGMRARITVDALPGRIFSGRVSKIGILPDAQMSWLNSNLKVYTSEVLIDGDAAGLRPGMNCMVDIIVEQYQTAVYVPVQSIVELNGQQVAYVNGKNGPEPVPVELGLNNGRMVRILSGLQAGQRVLLAPPLQEREVESGQTEMAALEAALEILPDAAPIAPAGDIDRVRAAPAGMPNAAPGGDGGATEPAAQWQRRAPGDGPPAGMDGADPEERRRRFATGDPSQRRRAEEPAETP